MEDFASSNQTDNHKVRRKLGNAYDKALDYYSQPFERCTVLKVDYIVTVICRPAEGMYQHSDTGELVWVKPSLNSNQYIAISIQDQEDHRFVPYLSVFSRLYEKGVLIDEKNTPFVWHPLVFHYGQNWFIPKESDYNLKIYIKSPQFNRLSVTEGKRYLQDESVNMGPLHLKPYA